MYCCYITLGNINCCTELSSVRQHTMHFRQSSSFSLKLPKFIPPDFWPPNSPDLNPVDYEIWDIMQGRVYQTPVRDVTDLRQHLTDCRRALWTMQLMNGKRLQASVNEKGHFENLQ